MYINYGKILNLSIRDCLCAIQIIYKKDSYRGEYILNKFRIINPGLSKILLKCIRLSPINLGGGFGGVVFCDFMF